MSYALPCGKLVQRARRRHPLMRRRIWRCSFPAWQAHPLPSAGRRPPCVSARSDPHGRTRAHSIKEEPLVSLAGIFLHGFGQRYDLPAPLALYLFAAGGVVVVSFVLVVMFAGGQVGPKAVAYPRRAAPLLTRIAQTPWPRLVGSLIGVLGLAAVIITGLFGSTDNDRNPAEYLTFFFNDTATTEIYTLSLHDALRDVPVKFTRQKPLGTYIADFYCSSRQLDRKSTRLNSSHLVISYAVFCLKKKKK